MTVLINAARFKKIYLIVANSKWKQLISSGSSLDIDSSLLLKGTEADLPTQIFNNKASMHNASDRGLLTKRQQPYV